MSLKVQLRETLAPSGSLRGAGRCSTSAGSQACAERQWSKTTGRIWMLTLQNLPFMDLLTSLQCTGINESACQLRIGNTSIYCISYSHRNAQTHYSAEATGSPINHARPALFFSLKIQISNLKLQLHLHSSNSSLLRSIKQLLSTN